MNENDHPRPTPRPGRPSSSLLGLAGAIVAVSVLFITLVAAPSSKSSATPEASMSEPPPETFAAIAPVEASSPTPSMADWTVPSIPAPSPSAAPVVSPSPVVDVRHVATRVNVPALRIDLPVVAPPKDLSAYPKCNVAMYIAALHQPGEGGATYLYAHARAGMFLPIYERAIQRLDGGPNSMLGLAVEVYTSDDLRYRYRIDQVRLHQTSLSDAAHAQSDELWLQTSEGPKGTRGKTQLRAEPVGVDAATHREAHPVAKPVTCG